MSVSAMQQLIFDLKRDKSCVELLRSAPEQVFRRYELSGEECRALQAGDLSALYLMGVHPLLLAPFSRMVGISRPRYQELLAPLKGARFFSSAYGLEKHSEV